MDNFFQRPSDEELRLFSERIARRLSEQPLEVDPAAQREQVAGLLRMVGETNLYQVLGIAPTASLHEVHTAYDRVGRLVHPANAARLGLEGKESVLEVLFENATQAYLTLSSLERRKLYDRDLDPAAWTEGSPAARAEEGRQVARRYYERAVEMVDAQEFYLAIELLQQAVRSDPQGEYYALLGKLQARNPNWLREAAESLRRAYELGAKDPELPAALDSALARLRAQQSERAVEALRPPEPDRAKKRRETAEVEVVPGDDEEVDIPLPEPGRKRRKGKQA